MPSSIASPSFEPSILASSSTWIAVDKPADWLTHAAGTDVPDLITWLAQQGHGTFAPVHRLDRGTSGVVFCAHPKDIPRWSEAFTQRTVEKRYQALVFGLTRAKGTLRRPLQDGRRGKPLPAETRYKTLHSFKKWSHLELHPMTGRKHQLRRHLQGIGHAVVGDERYRPRGKPTVPAFPGRLWLHCDRLELPGLPAFHSSLPDALESHLQHLRQREGA